MSDATFQNGAFSLKVKFPSGSSTARAGSVFAHDDSDTYYAIILRKNSGTDTIELVEYTSGSGWGSTMDSATATITEVTEYTIRADESVCDRIKQRMVEAHVVGQSSATFLKDRNNFFGTGKIGVVSDKTSVTFDDFTYSRSTPYEPGVPGWYTSADISLDTGNNKLTVTRLTYGGEAASHGRAGRRTPAIGEPDQTTISPRVS